ncbi:uncharacterized protein LOC135813540 [Sycon ciliatum]|uniref:uncharacterized protein LOC135813540 n=1 Tax=Sycon ciliatum TaxID=27933 RepID=UPI0031F6181E
MWRGSREYWQFTRACWCMHACEVDLFAAFAKARSADSGYLPQPSLEVEEDAAPGSDSEAPTAEEGVVECKGYRLQLHREENKFEVSTSTCAQSGMRLFRRKDRKALKKSQCFKKLLGSNQGLLVWMRVKNSKTATMDLSTGEDGPEQSKAASLCAKAPSAESGDLPQPSLEVEEDVAPSSDREAPTAEEEVSKSQSTSAKGLPLFSSGVVECKGYRLQLHREENKFEVSASTCAQSGMRLFRRKDRKALKKFECFKKLLASNQGLLVWLRVKNSKTATMDLSTGEDGPEQSTAASLCVLKPTRKAGEAKDTHDQRKGFVHSQ